MLGETLEMFLGEARARLVELTGAVERGDARALELAAHRLKGGAAMVGANRLAHLCEGLEQQGRQGSVAGAAGTLAGVGLELERVRAALKPLLPSPVAES